MTHLSRESIEPPNPQEDIILVTQFTELGEGVTAEAVTTLQTNNPFIEWVASG
jgi:hypothetical protein